VLPTRSAYRGRVTYLAATIVHAKSLQPVVAAVKAAYAAIGAREGGDCEVIVGAPAKGWVVITEGSAQSADLAIAAALANSLDTKVAAIGMRGSDNYGTSAARPFGTWPKKPPSSGKPGALRTFLRGQAITLPSSWDVFARAGTRLRFDLSRATRTPGPFKASTTADLREAEMGAQADVAHTIVGVALNGRFAEIPAMLSGLYDAWGWQNALDQLMGVMQSNSVDLEPASAALYLQVAERALDGVTSATLAKKWLVRGGHRDRPLLLLGMALLCALVAGDRVAWKRHLAQVAAADRDRYGLYVWTKSPTAIAELSPAMRKLLAVDLPVKKVLATAAKGLRGAPDWLDDATQLAAREGDTAFLDRVFAIAARDRKLASRIHYEAMKLVAANQYVAALLLFDRLLALPASDLTVFTNALYAVQADNNGRRVDRVRAARYVANATPHADANPAIYINLACVHLELGDRDAMFGALEAAKRHRVNDGLAMLRDQAMFAPLRRDPRFRALVR